MGNKITLTKPELIDFIAETVKDIISTKQQEKILDEQGFLSGLFGDEGTITPYKPDEAETDIDDFTTTVENTTPKDAYDILKMFDDMLLQGIDVRKVLETLNNLPNWERNHPNPSVKEYFKSNPDMVAKVPKLSSVDIKSLTELLKIIEVPFVNKKQGNDFRVWMNKNHPDWKAKDGDELDPKGSYDNKWISEAWRQYRNEFIKTDSYVPEIPYSVLSSALTCIKTMPNLIRQYNFSELTNIKNVDRTTKELTPQEQEAILDYIKTNLGEQTSNKDGKKVWKKEVEALRKTLKTHDSRVALATQLDPGFKLVTQYQKNSTEPGYGLGGVSYFKGAKDSCTSLGKWLIEIKFTEEDEYQAQFDELDSDGDGKIKLAPDAGNECMMCHRFIGPNSLTPNAQDRLLMNIAFKSMGIMDERIYQLVVDVKDWFIGGGYHYIIDIVAFVAYLTCPFTGGIGCAVSVALDLVNAYTYVKFDDDYYNAGMQIAFAVVPGGEGAKYLLKNAAAKKAIGNFFRKVWGKGELKNAMKSAKQEFKALGPAAKKELKEVFGPGVKFIKNGLKKVISGLNTVLRLAKNYLPSALYATLKTIVNIITSTFRAIVYAIEIFVYDPGLPAQLIELIGGKNSFSDWLKRQPKIGLKIWSKALETAGSLRGTITTTPYDCTGNVFVWFQKDMMSDDDVSVEQQWLQDRFKKEDFNEENVWVEWKTGWRPETMTNQVAYEYHLMVDDNDELKSKYSSYLKDCITFMHKMESDDVEDVKILYTIFTELGFTDTDIEELRQTMIQNEEVKSPMKLTKLYDIYLKDHIVHPQYIENKLKIS